MIQSPTISFGIIVLNGEPFIGAQLEALYPHALQIIIVHGAVERAAINAASNRLSLDNTGTIIKNFQENSDPENKVILIERNEFWENKEEMCNAFGAEATCDFLWQIDVDEFYLDKDIENIRSRLRQAPETGGVTFRWRNFWGTNRYVVEGWFQKMGGDDVSRIIRWGKKYRYAGHHISPRSIAPNGIESHTLPQISAQELASNNIFCYHYGLIFPSQVFRKQSFYSGGGKLSSTATRDQQSDCEEPNRWAQQVWRDLKDPFHVHNVYMHLAWLVKYRGPQPEITKQLFSESGSFFLPEPWRGDKDINELISQFSFRFKRRALIILAALNFHPATPPGLRKAASLISCSLAQQGLRKTSTSVLNKISKKLKVYE